MPKDVLFETESAPGREQIAEFFEEKVAYHRKRGGSIGMFAGEDAWIGGEKHVSPSPSANSRFKITFEREGPADGPGTKRLGFELAWDENDEADDTGK